MNKEQDIKALSVLLKLWTEQWSRKRRDSFEFENQRPKISLCGVDVERPAFYFNEPIPESFRCRHFMCKHYKDGNLTKKFYRPLMQDVKRFEDTYQLCCDWRAVAQLDWFCQCYSNVERVDVDDTRLQCAFHLGGRLMQRICELIHGYPLLLGRLSDSFATFDSDCEKQQKESGEILLMREVTSSGERQILYNRKLKQVCILYTGEKVVLNVSVAQFVNDLVFEYAIDKGIVTVRPTISPEQWDYFEKFVSVSKN